MEKKDNNLDKVRQARRAGNGGTQEYFTPRPLVDMMLDKLPADVFTDFSKTILEPSAGNGNFIIAILERRFMNVNHITEITMALSTVYAVELMPDNVDEMKDRIKDLVYKKCGELYSAIDAPDDIASEEIDDMWNHTFKPVIDHNIVCHDFFTWDFERWEPLSVEEKVQALF